jgi:hypothetical protein
MKHARLVPVTGKNKALLLVVPQVRGPCQLSIHTFYMSSAWWLEVYISSLNMLTNSMEQSSS